MALNAYDRHPETAKLKPWLDAMFTGASFSILNYDTSFFDLVKGDKVKIHIAELDHLSPRTVHLSDGTVLESDVLLANTGWKHAPPIVFLPEGIELELGIPHRLAEQPQDLASLIVKADADILSQFARLRSQPKWNENYVPLTDLKAIGTTDLITPYSQLTPFMLHRFIVPPSERFLRNRDIAFAGMVTNFSNTLTAHLQGLWIGAYFSGRLLEDPAAALDDEKSLENLRYEAVLHNRFGHWRYPNDWGNRCPSFIFDAVPYLDLLQRDLGLDNHRKRGFWSELMEPYRPADYQDVNDEWQRKHGHAESE